MIKIRRNVFETNSSSTHSLCLCMEDDIHTPPKWVYIEVNEFSWDWDVFVTSEEKMSYLYTYLCRTSIYYKLSDEENIARIENIQKTLSSILEKVGCEAKFERAERTWVKLDRYGVTIDHYDCWDDRFVRSVLSNIANFLDDRTIIVTGNDNEETPVEIEYAFNRTSEYKCKDFYKGN